MPIAIELSGGPHDGMQSVLSDDALDWLYEGRVPELFRARPDFFGEPIGVYRVTRSLTRQGRLIYKFWRGED